MRRLTPDRRAAVLELRAAGLSYREITARTGIAKQTARDVLVAADFVDPPCGCGRLLGHRGVCRALRSQAPERWAGIYHAHNAKPATTRLGRIIDEEVGLRSHLNRGRLAKAAGISSAKFTHIRIGAKCRVLVLPAQVDGIADVLGVIDTRRAEMHLAAVLDMGYRLPDVLSYPPAAAVVSVNADRSYDPADILATAIAEVAETPPLWAPALRDQKARRAVQVVNGVGFNNRVTLPFEDVIVRRDSKEEKRGVVGAVRKTYLPVQPRAPRPLTALKPSEGYRSIFAGRAAPRERPAVVRVVEIESGYCGTSTLLWV